MIVAFLERAGWSDAARIPLAGDASSRRYERLRRADGQAVLMDADPKTGETVTRFAEVARWLTGHGLSAPAIMAEDSGLGCLLLEDLGDAVFARLLEGAPEAENSLYSAAIDVLLELSNCPPPPFLAPLDGPALGALIEMTVDWYLPGMGGTVTARAKRLPALVTREYDRLRFLSPVIALRDYHAENLIWLPDRNGVARVGLLDFQDAVLADPAYDLVSLLLDARRDVAPNTAAAMMARYVDRRGLDGTRFGAIAALLGAQRSLRILGIFARLCLRDGKTRYLGFMARVWGHLERSLRHPEMADLSEAVMTCLPPPTPERLQHMREQCGRIPTP